MNHIRSTENACVCLLCVCVYSSTCIIPGFFYNLQCTNNCQDRNITCINFEPTDPDERWPVNDSLCAELRRPHSVRSCDSGVCSRGDWLAGPFTVCHV